MTVKVGVLRAAPDTRAAWCASQFSSRGLFHERPHVQQGILYGLGQMCRFGFFTGVKGRHGEVDVIIHGVVAHAVAIGHDGAKTHDTVRLGWHLATESRIRMLVPKMFQCMSPGTLP